MKILIVEDESHMRDLLKDMMSRFGVDEVYEAASGEKALEKFEEVKPDILFLDYYLPDINGKEILDDLDIGETEVVVMTGVAEKETKEECMKAGADEYLVKPFGMDDLKSLVED